MTTEERRLAERTLGSMAEEAGSALHVPVARERPLWERVWRQNKLAVSALALLVGIVILAVAAPILPLLPYDELHTSDILLMPGERGYLLGTDELGRDLLSRMIWGARTSLTAGFVASTLALFIGLTIGIAAGFYGGRIDDTLMRLTDVVLAFPTTLLAIGIIAVLGTGLTNAMIAMAIAGFPLYARIVRGCVLSCREMDFVLAARALGVSPINIMRRHLLPNVFAPVLITFTLDIGQMIIATSSLSFLGLGTQPPTPDWGNMIATARNIIRTAPHQVAIPGVAIFLVVLCCNVFGDGLRDALDPRLRYR
ncbi:MAG: ABC transporter permease [Anaerolineae bacterium]